MASKYSQGKYIVENPSKYIGSKAPFARSSWETAFMRFCDSHPNIIKWASENVKIPYMHPFTGKITNYVPDFMVQYEDKNGKTRVELIEVKPLNQTVKEKVGKNQHNQVHWVINQAKWQAARAWCKQKGIFFRIVTEGDLFHNGRRR